MPITPKENYLMLMRGEIADLDLNAKPALRL